jgi:hypothetical protein
MLLILEFHVSIQLLGFESITEAYQALCELWASPEYQEKSQNKRKSRVCSGKHTFGGDRYVHMGQRMVTHRI